MTREFHWMQQTARPRPATFHAVGDDPVVDDLDALGLVAVHGPAAYDDGGRHVVLEVVPDLEWMIADTLHNCRAEYVALDFHEACTRTHDLNRAHERAVRDAAGE